MNLRDNSLNLPLKMENNQCTVSMIHYTRQRYKRIERSKIMEYTTLSNGLKMPLLGFGVFQVPEADVCEKAVTDAIAIGVCNFYPHILADFCETVDIKPMVNQVELHPFFQQENALSVMKEYGVVPEAWGPFAEGNHGIFTHPVLAAIGEKYGKTPAQVALRWNVQRGVVVIPKSVHKERMEQNMDVWDFEILDEDMKEIAKLDLGHSEIVDHSNPEFVKMLHGLKVHD